MHSDILYQVALSRVPKVGPILSRVLYNYFGSARAVFEARPKELKSIEGVGPSIINSLKSPEPFLQAELIICFAERNGVQIIHFTDPDYPPRLKRQNGAPTLFYYRGTKVLSHQRTIAVIGTRQATQRGIAQTEKLLSGLKAYQPLVISGLAYGIDICAHRAALEHDLPTIGVLGSGLDQIYPSAHRHTARAMFENGGLLSTYPHFIGPEREHFPARNRVVAMLADIIVVVESDQTGGSIITANMGRSMNVPIAAFPGRWDDKKSAGCNAIIKQGGHLIESAEDVAKILQWQGSNLINQQGQLFKTLSTNEQNIVSELGHVEGLSMDELGRKLTWTSSQLAIELLNMEVKGLVKVLPGQRYRLAY